MPPAPLRAVTRDGDLVGAGWVSGGSDRKPSTLEITSEIAKARAELAAAETQTSQLGAALSGAMSEQTARQDSAEQALAALNESDAAISAIYEQLGRLGQDARAADEEWRRLLRQREELEAGRAETLGELGELETRLRNVEQTQQVSAEPSPGEARQQIAAAAETARGVEVEARLAVRTAEERANAVRGRADSLRRAAAAEREARLRAQQARAAREHAAAVAAAVADAGRRLAARLDQVVGAASRNRDVLAAERQQRSVAMAAVREEVNALGTRIGTLTESLHRDEVAKAQAALRIEQLEQMVLEQFGMAPDDLVAEYGPQVSLPPTELEMAEYEQARERGEQVTAPAPMPFDRPTQERRAKRAERELAELGRVNPLALEEFAALEERYNFLSTQLEDVKAARKDLLDVVADVDARILQVFADAYADVEREFQRGVRRAVPRRRGPAAAHRPRRHADHRHRGRGPPARQEDQAAVAAVRRGEVADRGRDAGGHLPGPPVAVLHHGRGRGGARRRQPAPADRACSSSCAAQSQLIIITHQKPTMEVADALYGVTMRDDGITAVISQRMRGQQVNQLVTTT